MPGVALAWVLGTLRPRGVPLGCSEGIGHPHICSPSPPLPGGTAKGQRSPCPLHPTGTRTALGINGAAGPGREDGEQELG